MSEPGLEMPRRKQNMVEGNTEECREACGRGRIGEIYKYLRKIGTIGRKAQENNRITVNMFKEYFEQVLKERYEEDSSVIAGVIERVNDLRGDTRTKNTNEMLNKMSDREEIMSAM